MTKPSHYMFGLLAAFGLTAAIVGGGIVPETGRLPFESEEQVARKEARYEQRQRASGRMIDPGRGDFTARGNAKSASSEGRNDPGASGTDTRSSRNPDGVAPGGPEVGGLPAWSVRGVVRIEKDPSGASGVLPEARLPWGVALELVPIGAGAHQGKGTTSALCSEDGSYRLEGLLPGLYRLRAQPRCSVKDALRALPIAMDLDLPRIDENRNTREPASENEAGRVWPHNIVLPQPRRLFGRVFQENEPRAGVRVSVRETGLVRGTAVSDARGRFEIANVGGGPWQFVLEDENGKDLTLDRFNAKDDFARRRVEASVVVSP